MPDFSLPPGLIATGRLRLRHLQCFVAVARLGRLRAAAEALSITQPAVTKTLNELEDIVGVRLFVRERRGAVLTAAGRAFLPHVADGLGAVGLALDSVRQRPETQVVRIGMLPTVAPALLAPAVAAWEARHPDVALQVTEGTNAQLMAQLLRLDLDLAVARLADPQEMPGVTFEYLYAEPLAVVVRPAHPLARRGRVILGDLLAYRLILPPAGTLIRHGAESLLAGPGGGRPRVLVETLSVSVARSLLWVTDAIWLTSPSAVAPDVGRGQLCLLEIDTAGTDEPVGLLLRSDAAPPPPAQALMAELRRVAGERRETAPRP
ncbi:MAG: LysR substrate-binding domain-containing protein [Pigmentiphaga sp.]|nr:LysR substrate-binding domain-containing protein [Pigmentiphaga sp.]